MSASASFEKDTRDIVRGTLVNFLGVIARSLNFIFFIILGRFYGSELTGLYLLSWASVDVFSKLAIMGLDRGVLTLAAKHDAADDKTGVYRVIAQSLFIGCIASVVMIIVVQLLAEPIAIWIYKQPELALPLRIMGFGMLFWMISAILLFSTRALRIMKYEVLVKSVSEPIVLLGGAILFYYLGLGILGLALAFLLSTLTGAILATIVFARELPIEKVAEQFFSKEKRRNLINFSAPIGIYDMLNLLLQRIDMFMLGYFVPISMVGIYGIAEEAAFTIKKVRQSFDPIFIPVISAASERGDMEGAKQQYRQVSRWILLLDLALLGIFVLCAESIMAIFSAEFTVGASTLILLSLSIVINGTFGISELFILIKNPMINLFNTIGTILINVLLNIILIPRYGMAGAALAITISYIFMNAARLLEVYIMFRLHPFSSYHLKACVASTIAFALGFIGQTLIPLANTYQQIISALIFVVIYISMLAILKLSPEDKVIFKNAFAKG